MPARARTREKTDMPARARTREKTDMPARAKLLTMPARAKLLTMPARANLLLLQALLGSTGPYWLYRALQLTGPRGPVNGARTRAFRFLEKPETLACSSPPALILGPEYLRVELVGNRCGASTRRNGNYRIH